MSISIDMARRIAEACKQRARELRSPVSIAIVDAGGHLVLFERMMSPYGWATSNISIAKATTAVMFNQSTDEVAQWGSGIPGFASSLATMTNGKFIMAAGGWPIRVGGATIGGIGISGGNAPGRDDEIARIGLAAIDAVPVAPAQPMAQGQAYTGVLMAQHPPAATPYVPPSAPPAVPQAASGVRQQGEALNGNEQKPARQLTPDQENPYNASTYEPSVTDNSGDQT